MNVGDEIRLDQMTILYSLWWEYIWKIGERERRQYAFEAFIEAHALNVGVEQTRWYISKLTDTDKVREAEEIISHLPSIAPRDSLGCLLTYMPPVNAPFDLAEYVEQMGIVSMTECEAELLPHLPPWAIVEEEIVDDDLGDDDPDEKQMEDEDPPWPMYPGDPFARQ